MPTNDADRWEIDQDDGGHPLVRHRHDAAAIVAYVRRTTDGSRQARCPDCGETLEVPARDG
jgi:hypothetical protein